MKSSLNAQTHFNVTFLQAKDDGDGGQDREANRFWLGTVVTVVLYVLPD